MKSLLLSAIFALFTILVSAEKADLTRTFDWLDGGSYTGWGTIQQRYGFPKYSPTVEAEVTLFVDYNHTISIQSAGNSLGSFWVNNDGFWYTLPNGTCLYDSYTTYDVFTANYRELNDVDDTKDCDFEPYSDECVRGRLFHGLIRNGCDNYASVVLKTNHKDKVHFHSFEQVRFLEEGVYVDPTHFHHVAKFIEVVQIVGFAPGKPNDIYLELPDSCANHTDVLDYAAVFCPSGYNYTMCI
jgi:hypothetical protein